MILEDLILELKSRDQNKSIKDGFGEGMSWRGSYSEAAFEPVENTTFGEMLAHAEKLLGTTQTGYKGGEYEMHAYVDVHLAHYGETGEPINSYCFKLWDAQ